VEATVDRYGAKEIRISDPAVARGLAVAYPGVRYVEPKDNAAQSRAWALIVKAERADVPAPVVDAPPVPEVPPPTDADAPLFSGRWAVILAGAREVR
jgi:hypothetical protein